MRTATAMVAAVLCLGTLGCAGAAGPKGPAEVWKDARGGLVLQVRVPNRLVVRGEVLPVEVTAVNRTREDMIIRADSGALVYVTLWRRGAVGWEEIKRFPETTVLKARPWKLSAGRSHTFTLNVRVSPDWPTNEPLRLTAELNGRPELRVGGVITVFATRQERDRASIY